MNVYNRPLFRQAGGPAQMMPQDMAQQGMPPQGMAPQGMPPQGGSGVDPQMEQALTAAEQQSAAGMAEVGASYAESMMSGLDNAEDYKTVIDSIRGNALPMEARYSELASLVGEEDARKTPESVLTLIQPTIMMTEQGAMDSGIGELMRQVTGEIDMEAENGMPTEMGQGVGSLMTAGVGQQPTQNFSLGGPVVRMGTGGNPRLEQLSSEILGNYRNIMGDGEDQKKLTQAQILFDIADAAGRFASGTNAQGQSVAGLSPFAQLGAATSGLGGRIGERVGELDKQDRALKLSALGAAQTEYNAEQAAARAATKDKALGDPYNVVSPEGKVLAQVFLSTSADYTKAQQTYGEGVTFQKPPAASAAKMMIMVNPNNLSQRVPLDTNSPEYPANYAAQIKRGFVPIENLESLQKLGEQKDPKIISLYKGTQVVDFDVSIPEERKLWNERLKEGGWTVDPTVFKAENEGKIAEQFKIKDENRQTAIAIEAELRANGYKLDERDLDYLEAIAAEERALGTQRSLEDRQEKLEQKRFIRDQGQIILNEQRARGFTLDDRSLDLAEEIAREERNLNITRDAEQRQAAFEQLRWSRDTAEDDAKALRQRGFIVEDRDIALVEAIAKEARDQNRTLGAEERSALYEQARFDRDKGETIATELRARGFKLEDQDLDLMAAIAAEERALGTQLSFEARKTAIEDLRWERDQRAVLATEIRQLKDKIDTEGRALANAPVKGIPAALFNAMDAETQKRVLLGEPTGVKGIPRDIWDSLPEDAKLSVLGTGPSARKAADIFVDVPLLRRIIDGSANELDTAEFLTAVAQTSARSWDASTGTMVQNKIPRQVQDAIAAYNNANPNSAISVSNERVSDDATPSFRLPQAGEDVTLAFGASSVLLKVFGITIPGVLGLGVPAPQTATALAEIENLNAGLITTMLANNPGKDNKALQDIYRKTLPDPASLFADPAVAIRKYGVLLRSMDSLIDAQKAAIDGGRAGGDDLTNRIQSLALLRNDRLRLAHIVAQGNAKYSLGMDISTNDSLSAYTQNPISPEANKATDFYANPEKK
jgi:hypothetical protein